MTKHRSQHLSRRLEVKMTAITNGMNFLKGSVRRILLLLIVIMLLGAVPGGAAPSSTLTVVSVLAPVPLGTEPGGQMFLQATVNTSGDPSGLPNLVFYLGQDSSPGPDDVQIATTSVSLCNPNGTCGVAGLVPQDVPPGSYYVLACGDNCVASQGTIDVLGQALSAVDQSTNTTVQPKARVRRFFPDDPKSGITVGGEFDCDQSAHGQSPAKCVWVKAQRRKNGGVHNCISSTGWFFEYCPSSYPFPYQVWLGDDPKWENLSDVGVTASVGPVSFTKNKWDLFGGPFSYAGALSNTPGYVAVRFFFISFPFIPRRCDQAYQVQYTCTNKFSTVAAP